MLDNTVCDQDRHKLLNILCKMCSRQQKIPKSMHMVNCLQGELIEERNGGYATVFRGKHKGRAVAIKILRLYLTSDLDKCFRAGVFTLFIAEVPTDTVIPGVHSRSDCMEASPASEYPTVAGRECGSRTVPARDDVRMDGPR